MKSNHIAYNYDNSKSRIDEILNTSDTSYEELKYIPSRDRLTFNNGFYVKCTVLYVDIRKSKELPKNYKRPALARIFRSYISEVVAVLNGDKNCVEITIEGDCVWGVFDTPKKDQIDEVFSTSARVSSIIDTLNIKYKKKNYGPIKIGIGIHYGRALMIKAGYGGSGLNEVVWMGEVVNEASKLCSFGNKTIFDKETMISETYFNNLKEKNKKLFKLNNNRGCFHGNIVNTYMDKNK